MANMNGTPIMGALLTTANGVDLMTGPETNYEYLYDLQVANTTDGPISCTIWLVNGSEKRMICPGKPIVGKDVLYITRAMPLLPGWKFSGRGGSEGLDFIITSTKRRTN